MYHQEQVESNCTGEHKTITFMRAALLTTTATAWCFLGMLGWGLAQAQEQTNATEPGEPVHLPSVG